MNPRWPFVLSLTLAALGLSLSACEPTAEALGLPAYEVAEDNTREAPISAVVSKRIIVTEPISEEELLSLLEHLFQEGKRTRGWTYHREPTLVAFYVHSDQVDHFSNNWLGMVIQGPMDDAPRYDVKPAAIGVHNSYYHSDEQTPVRREHIAGPHGVPLPEGAELHDGYAFRVAGVTLTELDAWYQAEMPRGSNWAAWSWCESYEGGELIQRTYARQDSILTIILFAGDPPAIRIAAEASGPC